MASTRNAGAARRKAARLEEMCRAERARVRRMRVVASAVGAVAAAGVVAGCVLFIASRSEGTDSSDGTASHAAGPAHFVTGKDGVKTWTGKLSRNHVFKTVHYPMDPPVGGDHYPVWLNCDGVVYTQPVDDRKAVHSLEHGAVWVTYNRKTSKADVDTLAAQVRKTPYALMSPDSSQKDPIMLTAWAHQRTVTGANDPNIAAFFEQFDQGRQTPEPGAPCTDGLSR
ncbi:DUF3105 domain-containing protein [Streptomyces sp. NPDC050523]|uniref:DUF3105 domain-containing protein n=1 Tax=Streptomyces sp. NPDC050523 TaxID=3365622 RepID=UPI003789DB6B